MVPKPDVFSVNYLVIMDAQLAIRVELSCSGPFTRRLLRGFYCFILDFIIHFCTRQTLFTLALVERLSPTMHLT